MTSSQFDPGSISIRLQKPWTSPVYGSMNNSSLKTLIFLVLYLRINRILLFMGMIYFLIDLLGSVTTNNVEFYNIIKLDPWLTFLFFFLKAYSFFDQNDVVFSVMGHIRPIHIRFSSQNIVLVNSIDMVLGLILCSDHGTEKKKKLLKAKSFQVNHELSPLINRLMVYLNIAYFT